MFMLGLRAACTICGKAKHMWSIVLVFLLPTLAVVAPVHLASAQETDAVKAPPCDLPPVPSDVRASRSYTDYVQVTWSGPVGAVNIQYQVYRQDFVPGPYFHEDVSLAHVVRSWENNTSFADYTAPPPDTLFSWGCNGEPGDGSVPVSAFYWVKARNSCGTSGYSDSAEGWRTVDYDKRWSRPDEKSLVKAAKAEFVDAGAGADSTGGETTLAALDGTEAVPGFAGAIGQTYRICPDAAFEAPQEIWLPVPEGVDIQTLDLYYFDSSGSRDGWYLAKNVQGFLEPDSREVGELDGVAYIGFLVNHAGIIRLGQPAGAAAAMQAAVVPCLPTCAALTDMLVLSTMVLILMVAGGRFRFARARKTP